MPETRTKILGSAARAFSQKGFHRATVREIAADARVSENTVFRYFPGKSDLYWAAVDHKLERSDIIGSLHHVIKSAETPAELVLRTSTCLLQILAEDDELHRLLNFTFLELERERQLLWTGRLRPLLKHMSDRLNDWMEAGALRRVDSQAATRAIIGFILSQQFLAGFEANGVPSAVTSNATGTTDISMLGLLPR